MIEFETIRYKNFFSCGNSWIEIKLNSAATTLILGSNGTGKSTILDALCFCLFGKPYRKIKKDQLINSVNGRECVVEIEFSTRGDRYLVRRGIKPNTFQIFKNEEELQSNAATKDHQEFLESSILKLNFKSFTQLVILGSAGYVPFMQLTAAERRALVEDILDIQVFSVMNDILKARVSKTKQDIATIEHQIHSTTEAIELVEEAIENLKKQASQEVDKKQSRISEIDDMVLQVQNKIQSYADEIDARLEEITEEKEYSDKQRDYQSRIVKIRGKIREIREELEFYGENDSCPTCGQDIDAAFRAEKQQKNEELLTKYEEGIQKVNEKADAVEQQLEKIREVKDAIADVRASLQAAKREAQMLLSEKKRIEDDLAVVDTTILQKEVDRLDTLLERERKNEETRKDLAELKHLQDIAAVLLKDGGIKTAVIRKFLPHINRLINKYLDALNFPVSFVLDELFEEQITSRHRDNYAYGSFSEGEKLRIDLAILFTWREIARLKNSMATNLLLLDEVVDSSLDSDGIDHFMKLLNELAKSSCVFVISHKSDMLSDRFERTLTFSRTGNFSKMLES